MFLTTLDSDFCQIEAINPALPLSEIVRIMYMYIIHIVWLCLKKKKRGEDETEEEKEREEQCSLQGTRSEVENNSLLFLAVWMSIYYLFVKAKLNFKLFYSHLDE